MGAPTEWVTAAMAIVDRWEQTHDGRLLSTVEAGRLVHLVAVGLAEAYERGAADHETTSDDAAQ